MSPSITRPFALAFTLGIALDAHASPPIATQVDQVAQWFTGEFDNSAQVAENPQVPAIHMSTCDVELLGATEEGVRTVYLEQFVAGSPIPLRVRLYTFRPAGDRVRIAIQRFTNQGALLGMCSREPAERVIAASSVVPTTCNVDVQWSPATYAGSNAPTGCPASFPGGKVVSEIEIHGNGSDSLDRILDAAGNQLAGTLIEFRRIED
jgi:hypothetical protein